MFPLHLLLSWIRKENNKTNEVVSKLSKLFYLTYLHKQPLSTLKYLNIIENNFK